MIYSYMVIKRAPQVALDFPCGSGDLGLIPGLGKSPGEGKGYPFQYSGLENSMDCIVHGIAKSRTWLSDFHSGGTSGKEPTRQCWRHKRRRFDPWVGKILWRRAWQTNSGILAWRLPWTEELGGLQAIGSQRIKHNWRDLAYMHGDSKKEKKNDHLAY